MVLDIALGGMLLLFVGVLLACHHFGWLADYILRGPSKNVKLPGSSWGRLPGSTSDGQFHVDQPSEVGPR